MRALNSLHKLSGRERFLLTMVVLMSTVLIGYFGFIEPPATKVRKLRRSLSSAEQTLKMRREQTKQSAQLQRSQAELLQTFESIHKRMFSPTELHPLLKQLAQDVQRSDCELISILPSTSSTTNRPGTVLSVESIEIRLRGSYRALTETVRRVEQKPRFVSIDDILIETTSKPHELQAVLTLHVYSFNSLDIRSG